ncbi:MAG TPA: ATP-binding protein [Clostridiales bacterium]|nr:ATP-binding protein [Clostridiales bacterium]
MSTSSKKLFTFDRDLPEPFDKLPGKTTKVTSQYGDGTKATLSSSMIKAVQAYCNCKNGSGKGAVGRIDHRSVAEYKSAMGAHIYHLVVYDPSSGNILASSYETDTENISQYTVHKSARDGAAVLLAMIPELMKDDEFAEHMDAYFDCHCTGWPDLTKATEHMAILCDNAYRRMGDEACAAHVKVVLDSSGNIMRVSMAQIEAGSFVPSAVIAGEFLVFAQTGPAPVYTPSSVIDHSVFIGKYPLSSGRALNVQEQSMIPKLPEWYILPEQVVSVCRHAMDSSKKQSPMRNFLLRGPAGTGKTEGAKAIAAGVGLPYLKYTCSANTEIFDLVGMVFPDTETASTGDAMLDQERDMLKTMGGVTYDNVAKLMNLPGLDDIDYDAEGTYLALTGIEKTDATSQDCMRAVLEKVMGKVQQLSRVQKDGQSSGQTYSYVETDFIRALRYGYCVEIQEPATIMQPGVLVGLNSLLEQGGSITLPTGEVIRRHPDAVVIVTTNISYEGCRGINQSVLDRMNLIQDIELPTAEVMAQRAMSVTGCDDEYMVSKMVQVVCDMSDYCRKNGIQDGSTGMRGLIDWIISAEITGDPYTSALYTLISKASSDEDDRQALITNILEPHFPPRRKRAV